MKKQIIKNLRAIQKLASVTKMEGKISISVSGCSIDQFDELIESINEFPRINHFIEVAPKLTVAILMD